MVAAIRLVLVSMVAVAAAATSGCHAAGCRDSGGACGGLTDIAVTTDEPTSTTSSPMMTTTADVETTEAPPTSGTSVTPTAVCGDGVAEGDELCDDGNDDELDACKSDCTPTACGDGIVQLGELCDDGDDDNTDSCAACQPATCGDGFLRAGVEVCDDGAANDDAAYGGCTESCVPGPRCGDALINGPEECDDSNSDETDGCMSSCIEARSCLQIKEALPNAPTGSYRLWPPALGGEVSVVAWCDMDSDGGGYTFLKVDTEFGNESDNGAKKAEALCAKFGMQLLVTRTPAHTVAAYNFATTSNLAPIGGGNVNANVDYLAMLGIYPQTAGATCGGGALNSDDCPGWVAGDGMPYWVTSTPYLEMPDEDHCLGCSMIYKWNPDGSLKSYMTVSFGEGASSYRFLCDIGDKHP